MQNVVENLFAKALSREDERLLPKTNFTANHATITYSVAEALLSLDEVDTFSKGTVTLTSESSGGQLLSNLLDGLDHFTKGTVELISVFNQIDGFVYQEEDTTVVLITSNNDRKIDKIYCNEPENDAEEKIKKAILYMDVFKDATGYGIKSKIISALNGEISEEEVIEQIEKTIIPTLRTNVIVEEMMALYNTELSEYFSDIPSVAATGETTVTKEGYIYQKGESVLFLNDTDLLMLTMNRPEEQMGNEMIQAMLLLDMTKNLTGMNITEKVNILLNQSSIEQGSENAEMLQKLVEALDIHFYQTETLVPARISVDESMTIQKVEHKGVEVIKLVEKPVFEEVQVIEEEKDEVVEERQNDNFEQFSLFDDEPKAPVVQTTPAKVDVYSISARLQEANARGYTLNNISNLTTDEHGKVISESTLSEIARLTRTTARITTLNRIAKALDQIESKAPITVEKAAQQTQQNGVGVDEMAVMQGMKTLKQEVQPVVRQVVEQVVVKPVIMEEEVPTINQINTERPLIHDDDAIVAALYKLEYSGVGALSTKDDFIEAVLAFRKEQREKNVPQSALMEIEKKMIYVGDPEPLIMGIINMMQGIHVLYTGPAGAGKTVLAQTISAVLNMPLYTMNGNVDTDSDAILGSKEASNGSTYAVRGLMVKALENAGIFYGDEVNFILNEILAVANPALDHRKEVYNPNTHQKIIGHPNFRFIGSMNVGYQGTRELNEATNDRFVAYEVDYMPESALIDYIQNYDPGYTEFQRNVLKMNQIPYEDVLLIADIAKTLQREAKNPDSGLPQEVGSIRNINQIIQQSRNLPMHLAVATVIQKYRKNPEEQLAIRGVLQSVNRLDLGKMKLNASDIIR